MATVIQIKRGTSSDWTASNPILAAGEIGLNTTSKNFRVGDGSTNWSSLTDWITSSGSYTLPSASSTVLGGIKLFSDTVQSTAATAVSSTASRTYGAQLNSSGQLVVNVPWTDTIYSLPASVVSKDANGNISVNNVQKGYTSVTSAGTTTTLTAASTYVQRITGTSAQTIQLPDTTTLTNGHVFIIDNDSTGAVTVNSSTSTFIDTVSAGSLGYFFVEDNTLNTAAAWGKYAYLPGSVDWGTSSVTGVPSITTTSASFALNTPAVSATGAAATSNNITIQSGTATTTTSGLASSGFLYFDSGTVSTTGGTTSPGIIAIGTSPFSLGNGVTRNIYIGNTGPSTTTIYGTLVASAPAGSLTGSTLASGVTASSLTSLGTLSTTLNLRSGTTTAGTAPLVFGTTTPAILSVPVIGTVENDTKVFYGTPAVGTATTGSTITGRGLVPTTMMYVVNSDTTIITASSTTVTGNVMSGKGAWLLANTTYEVEFVWYTEVAFTSGSTGSNFTLIMNFPTSANAWLSLQYTSPSSHTNQSTTIAWQAITDVSGTVVGSPATIQSSLATGTTYYNRYILKGTVSTGANAGYFYPQHSITAAAGATITLKVKSGSFGKVTPIGSSAADVNIGPWS